MIVRRLCFDRFLKDSCLHKQFLGFWTEWERFKSSQGGFLITSGGYYALAQLVWIVRSGR